jgi:hypothetical protein
MPIVEEKEYENVSHCESLKFTVILNVEFPFIFSPSQTISHFLVEALMNCANSHSREMC